MTDIYVSPPTVMTAKRRDKIVQDVKSGMWSRLSVTEVAILRPAFEAAGAFAYIALLAVPVFVEEGEARAEAPHRRDLERQIASLRSQASKADTAVTAATKLAQALHRATSGRNAAAQDALIAVRASAAAAHAAVDAVQALLDALPDAIEANGKSMAALTLPEPFRDLAGQFVLAFEIGGCPVDVEERAATALIRRLAEILGPYLPTPIKPAVVNAAVREAIEAAVMMRKSDQLADMIEEERAFFDMMRSEP